MRSFCCRLTLPLAVLAAVAGSGQAEPDIHDTRLLSRPAVSASHVALVYADDLWVADLDGGNVRRLTTDAAIESAPFFSPDGKTIAFSARHEGNVDVYVVPVTGGSPLRLTWHPGVDIVRGFTPDGKEVLFSSPRQVFTRNYTQLFTVPVTGGMPTQIPIPNGVQASFSPDGERIAYTPIADASSQWKHYRGGSHSRIWIYRRNDHSVEQIPQPEGRCNDLDPQWLGDTIWFRSDRNGEYNLFVYDTKTKEVKQVTHHDDFPVLAVGSGGGKLVYEQAGYLFLFDPAGASDRRLTIGVASDLPEARPHYVPGKKFVRNADVSPSGARAVFEIRGEIVTVPAEKGDPHNLTDTPGVHERSPVWSPDGKSIAYFSDEGGENRLHVRSADGKGKAKTYAAEGSGFYDFPAWSPDGKKVAYTDNGQSLYWIDLESEKVHKVASEPEYKPRRLRSLQPSWSPDSKWLAYSLGNKAAYHVVFVYDLATKKSRAITDGFGDALDPAFDADGKYLYFLASTDAGPVNQWFAMSNADMRAHRVPHIVVLHHGEASPLARESDEEQTPAKTKGDGEKPGGAGAKGKEKIAPVTVAMDFEGISQRILALPVKPGNYSRLRAGAAGKVYYLEGPVEPTGGDEDAAATKLKRFDLGKRKSEDVLTGVTSYFLTARGSKALVLMPNETWAIVPTTGTPATKEPGKDGKLKMDAVEIRVDPRAEWPQIFDEAWRINRDYFYDPHTHGADWQAIRKKYAAFLPHLATRGDLDRVMRWMLSELAVGHSFLFPAPTPDEPKPIPGGLLGADYEIANGRYRFKKVFGGLNWTPDLRAPLTAPGVEAKAGEYLLAVRGVELKPPTEIYSLFENTAGKSIEITIGPDPDGKNSRSVTVEPLADELDLRNRDWIESNLRKVHKATDGRVAYVYVPNTTRPGHEYFKRYFFPQGDKEAIIVDERFNAGGQVADYYIDMLRRPFTSYWATRYGEDIKTPGAAIHGPKLMLIDETAGSGGDLLPWMFRRYKLGPLVGKRTWGGLVGMLGFPELMDGGMVTAPDLAIWTPEEGFVVENEGVPPDVEVEQWPADVIAGKDPQLEKAIALILKELGPKPSPPKRPPYPLRAKSGS
jgi:tricorn protease